METRNRHRERLHFLMSLIGGFLGVCAILHFSSLFGSAQTANLIALVTSLLGSDWLQFSQRLGGMLLYMAAISLTVYLRDRISLDLRLISVLLDACAAIITGLLPESIPPVLGLYPLFFAMAFQWNCFSGASGFASSSIFSTNNLRQFTIAITEVWGNHDHSQLRKAAFFGKTLLSFHAGVGIAFLLWQRFDLRTSWFCLLFIFPALYLVLADIRRETKAETAT